MFSAMFLYIMFWIMGSAFTQYLSYYPSYYSNYYNTYNYPQYSSNSYNSYPNYPQSYGYNSYYNNYGGSGWPNQLSSSGPGGCAPGYAKTCILGVCRVQCGNAVYDNPRDEEISILNKFG